MCSVFFAAWCFRDDAIFLSCLKFHCRQFPFSKLKCVNILQKIDKRGNDSVAFLYCIRKYVGLLRSQYCYYYYLVFYIKSLTEEPKSIPAFFGFFYFRNNILLLCCLYSYKNVVKEAADVLHFSQFFLGLQRKRFLKKRKKMLCIRSLCTVQRLVLRLRMEKCLKRDQVISLLE